jgi:adenosylcobinamide-phosphate synthase
MSPPSTIAVACLALAIEAAAGYPAPLYRAIGHPVTWMGRFLSTLEARLNRPGDAQGTRRLAGVLALVLLLLAVAIPSIALWMLAPRGALGVAPLAILAATLPAQRSLCEHVRAVAKALEGGDLLASRMTVGKIVGRDVIALDDAAVARAAIESLAENFSDGVVAPAFWLALGGLAGGAIYKAINTADSMIGHWSERYAAFGWAAARLDDLVNLPASRLAALWIALAAFVTRGDWREALRAVRRDAKNHRSPNAGWPEAAMAGALGLQIAGPRVYGGTLVEDAFMGTGRYDASAADLRRALRLYAIACVVQWTALAAVAVFAAL